MMIYTLTHEHKHGFTTYAFSSEALRSEASERIISEWQEDFDANEDFLTSDCGLLDSMPLTSKTMKEKANA